MSSQAQDPLIAQVIQRIEQSLTPQNRKDYDKIVVAGMQYGLQGGSQGVLASLKQSKDPVRDCVVGAVNVVMMLRLQSQGTMPERSMVPAGMTLMLLALDFADRAGIVTVDKAMIDKASKLYGNQFFAAVGITPDKLRQAAQKTHGVTEDPAQMEALKLRAGLTRDPRAATPTPLPGGE